MQETADQEVVVLESLHQANFPGEWQKVIVTPIFKGGNKDHYKANNENYRPISLKSTTCKNLAHIIHSNILSHLDQ